MTPTSITAWSRGRVNAVSWETSVLPAVDARYVPMVLADLEARKLAYFWETPAEHEVGYQALCEMGVSLLMGIEDRLIAEVRAIRDGSLTPLADRDPLADPYELPLTTLNTLNTSVQEVVSSVDIGAVDTVAKLEEIRLLVEAQGGGDLTEVLGKLDILIALL